MRTLIAVLLLSAVAACETPAAPQPRFLDKQTRLELATSVAAIGMDGYTTRSAIGNGWHEINPVARPFVSSNAGMAFVCAASISGEVGSMYLFRNHRVIKHLIPAAVTAVEIGFVAHNRWR